MPSPSTSSEPESFAGGHQPLVVVFLAAAVGTLLDRNLSLPPFGVAVGAATSLALWRREWRLGRDLRATAWLLLAVVLAFSLRHHLAWNLFPASDLARLAPEAGSPVCVEAVVLEGPRRVAPPEFSPLRAFTPPARSRCAIEAVRVRDGRDWRSISGEALLTVDGDLRALRRGDRIRVFGRLQGARGPLNPGQFDFASHDRSQGRLAHIWTDFPQCVQSVSTNDGWSVVGAIDFARWFGREQLERYIKPAQTGLAAALVLGDREQLTSEENEQFLKTGTVHILSISGLHVGMVAAAFFLLLRAGWLPRPIALTGVAAVTGAYALITDAGAPVTRAAILVALACLAMAAGRPRATLNALAFAALVVVAINPADLFRVGPQLSFLSVLTIFLAAPHIARLGVTDDPLRKLLSRTRPWPIRAARQMARRVGQALLLSAVISLVTVPLVLAEFHLFSPAAVVLNLLLWAPVALALLSGLGVVTIGWILPPLASALGAMCAWNLEVVEFLVAWGSRVPGGYFWLPGPAGWWLAGLYLVMTIWMLHGSLRPPVRWRVALFAVWVAAGLVVAPRGLAANHFWGESSRGQGELRCAFLAMGHGLSVVVELPDGQVLLYDAGQLGSPDAAARTVAGYLWSRGIRHLDAVVVSHADLDHFNGIPALAQRFSIGVVYTSPMMFEVPAASLEALTRSLTENAIPRRELVAGNQLRAGNGCQIEVLHPTRTGVLGSDNANSVVLAIEYLGRSVLLTGDLESPGLEAVLAEAPYDCDVLLAPHHGSAGSNPLGFAGWCQPEHVIVSGGYDVQPSVISAYESDGAEVLHTMQAGAIVVTIDDELRVETFRQR